MILGIQQINNMNLIFLYHKMNFIILQLYDPNLVKISWVEVHHFLIRPSLVNFIQVCYKWSRLHQHLIFQRIIFTKVYQIQF